jgi:hypothetical protein
VAGIVTTHARRGGAGCDHRDVVVTLDGEAFAFDTGEGPLDALPWDADAKRQFVLLALRRLRALGLSLDAAVGRICCGEEATNVKQYLLLAKDVTKTNIGTSYVNVPVGANGERTLVEFTGCAEFRLVANVNMVGVGLLGIRVIRDGDSAVLYENAAIAGTNSAGEKELDTGWLAVPQGVNSLEVLRVQMKSQTGADDPVARRVVLLVR